ncbi:hypothetical protein Tsubulata_049158 [Turnera subulata]|uniref:RRM domain-containing protein n=1 Tax=Turnera subulata TaxID=218843 RepID=A0A9Q0F8P0_9ROSI|nr:hypothetical protein Tsubulata_049158 [Turnera subulata]
MLPAGLPHRSSTSFGRKFGFPPHLSPFYPPPRLLPLPIPSHEPLKAPPKIPILPTSPMSGGLPHRSSSSFVRKFGFPSHPSPFHPPPPLASLPIPSHEPLKAHPKFPTNAFIQVQPFPQPRPISNPMPQYFSKWPRKQIEKDMKNLLLTTLYVENLPLWWSALDVHSSLSKFGDVMDVFIPKKLSKTGVRFCFVRFRKSEPPNFIIARINKVLVSSGTLRANIARNKRVSILHRTKLSDGFRGVSKDSFILKGKSFSDVVSSGSFASHDQGASSSSAPYKPTHSQPPIFLPNPPPVYTSKIAFVEPLAMPGFLPDASVYSMGGKFVLVCFKYIDVMKRVVDQKEDWVTAYFTVFKAWEEYDYAVNRCCWINVRGVPPKPGIKTSLVLLPFI